MTPSVEQVNAFTKRIGSICAEFGVPVNVRKIDFHNALIVWDDPTMPWVLKGTAYVQDIVDRDNRTIQFMLDAGGNVWENYQCFGPISVAGVR